MPSQFRKQRPAEAARPQEKHGPAMEGQEIEPVDDLLQELAQLNKREEVRDCGCGGRALRDMFRK